MDILGHEIDVNFIYRIAPVEFSEMQGFLRFKLDFKDGRSHLVKFRDDYTYHSNCRKAERHKDYNGNDVKKIDALIQKDTKALSKLRDKIIAEKNKTQEQQ